MRGGAVFCIFWPLSLIESMNPKWEDFYKGLRKEPSALTGLKDDHSLIEKTPRGVNYFKNLARLFSRIEVTDKHARVLTFNAAVSRIVKEIIRISQKGCKAIFIGNGGSAAIANHISTDFLKNAKVPAIVFNNSSLITCLSNDLGYEYVYEKPTSLLAKK
jgi:hypothetical protein